MVRCCWLLALVAEIAATPAATADGGELRALVELFTSQGCSSCPPADALLLDLADEPGIIVLSEHVDYWDSLGWKDPFASSAATARQRAYAKAFHLPYVFTPQVVINGARQMAGTNRDGILSELSRTKRPLPLSVTIVGATGAPAAVVGAPDEVAPHGGVAEVWLFAIEGRARTDVTRGENAGQTLEHVNVVREVRLIGGWRGGQGRFTFTPLTDTALACVAIVQLPEAGTILGATHREPCGE